MPSTYVPFSQRHGYARPKDVLYRDDLPARLRLPIVDILARYAGPRLLWERIEKVFDPYGTSPVPRTAEDDLLAARHLLSSCPWFRVYDLIEDLFDQFSFYEEELRTDPDEELRAYPMQNDVNEYFVHEGIGWQLTDGHFVARGTEAFEDAVNTAAAELDADRRPTAAGQIHEALQALSRRPEPNLRGAVMHGMGALECVARDVSGDPQATLGEVLRRHPDLLPRPVDEAIAKLWGYASNEARHVEEGREPAREDAEMIVGLAATIATYLTRKHRGDSH